MDIKRKETVRVVITMMMVRMAAVELEDGYKRANKWGKKGRRWKNKLEE